MRIRFDRNLPQLLLAVLAALAVAGMPAVARAGAAKETPQAGAHRRNGRKLERILDRVQKHFDESESFRAKFTETIAPVGGIKRTRSGTVIYRKPGRMRWEFADPEPETIVCDGTTVYTYQPDLNQVIESPVSQVLRSSSATSFLLGMGALKRDFDAELPPESKGDEDVRVTLIPKGGGDKVGLTLDPDSYDLRSLTLTDALGDVTTLQFSDLRKGVSLPDSMFAFKVPKGADIVTGGNMP
jgi:outer membrane lipoprotein carrier protein